MQRSRPAMARRSSGAFVLLLFLLAAAGFFYGWYYMNRPGSPPPRATLIRRDTDLHRLAQAGHTKPGHERVPP